MTKDIEKYGKSFCFSLFTTLTLVLCISERFYILSKQSKKKKKKKS